MKRKMIIGLVLGAGLMLAGCSDKASDIEYADADAAKEALNSASTVTLMEKDLDDATGAGDILADEKVAGYWYAGGFLDPTWTVSVDGKDWFYVKFVTDEPINDVEGVDSSTTYGYYDMDDNCLGYCQEQYIPVEDDVSECYVMFLDADGNVREDYYASEGCYELYDYDDNVIASVEGNVNWFGGGGKVTFTMEDGVDQEVDIKDKVAMMIPHMTELESLGD